jgi:hypothetical protein
MSPKATPRQARERGRRSKDKSEQRSPDMEESNEYMDSSISRPSSDISREDFIHFENAIAPYLHELAEVKRNIATSLHAVDELMDGLTGTFKGRMDIVKGVGETWGKEEEQSKKIEELTAFNEQLLRWSQEKGKELEDKIQTLIRERDHAQVEKEELEQKYMEEYATREQDLKDREKRLHSDYEKKMKALEIQKAEAKKELEKGKRLEIRGLNITIEKLTEENERHKCDLADLKNLVEKTDRAYESLGRENNSMRDQVDVIQRDFWVPEKPDDYL